MSSSKIYSIVLLLCIVVSACSTPSKTVSSPTALTFTPTSTFTSVPNNTPSPPPSPTATRTLAPKKNSKEVFSEFEKSLEYEEALSNYLNAMGLNKGDISISDQTKFISGEEYVIFYSIPDPTKLDEIQKEYADLYKPMPLFISQNDEKGQLIIKTITPSLLSSLTGLMIGTYLSPYVVDGFDLALKTRKNVFDSIITITNVWASREKIEGHRSSGYNESQIQHAIGYRPDCIRITHILTNPSPGWLELKPNTEFQEISLNYIGETMHFFYKKISEEYQKRDLQGELILEFNVVNEPWINQTYAKKFGNQNIYVLKAMEKAIEVRENIYSEQKSGDPNIIIELGLSHAESHYPNGVGFSQTIDLLTYLEGNGIHLDYVDLHGHEKDFSTAPSMDKIKEAIASFSRFTNPYGKPIKVVIGEYDLNISKLKNEDRLLQQAQRYFEVFTTFINSGVKEITLWELVDPWSWYESKESEPQYQSVSADPLVFFDDGSPKPSYYAIILALYEYLSN